MSEFIAFYVETAICRHPINHTDWELKDSGFIKKSDINFLGTSDRYDDCYFTCIANIDETLYVKKTDFDVEVEKQDNHWEQDFKTFKTIKQCIELLSTDVKGTKQQVKEKLEELIKDER